MSELFHSLGIEWSVMLAQLVNFAILLFILGKFVWKPVMQMLDARQEGVVASLARERRSGELLAEAEQGREETLTQARKESQKIIDEAKKDGEILKQKLLTEAKAEIARLKSEADTRLASEKVKLVALARRELGMIVVEAIESTLGDALDARTQGKMVEQALAAIREGDKKI